MTKKDYELVAQGLKEAYDQAKYIYADELDNNFGHEGTVKGGLARANKEALEHLARRYVYLFKNDNKDFNAVKFLQACGM